MVNSAGAGLLSFGAGRQEFYLSLGGTSSDRMGILQVGERADDLDGGLLHYQWHDNDMLFGRGIGFMPGRESQGVLDLHAISESSGEFGRLRFYRGELRSWETSQGPGGVSFDADNPGVLFPNEILPGAVVGNQGGNSFGRARQMLYSEIDDAFVFYWQLDDEDANRRRFIVKWSHHSGLEWAREFPGAGSVGNANLAQQSRLEGGEVSYLLGSQGSQRAVTLRMSDGGVLRLYPPEEVPSGAGESMIYDSRSRSGVNTVGAGRRVFFGRDEGETVALSEVVQDLCGRGGLGPADLDVSELQDVDVRGYVVGREASARRALEPLAQAYLFDAVESDGVLAFRKRGKPPVVQIGGAELLAADSETGEVFVQRRAQEVELPARVTVVHMDPGAEYEQGAQFAKRIWTVPRRPSRARRSGWINTACRSMSPRMLIASRRPGAPPAIPRITQPMLTRIASRPPGGRPSGPSTGGLTAARARSCGSPLTGQAGVASRSPDRARWRMPRSMPRSERRLRSRPTTIRACSRA